MPALRAASAGAARPARVDHDLLGARDRGRQPHARRRPAADRELAVGDVDCRQRHAAALADLDADH
jgi:hypothetical protein